MLNFQLFKNLHNYRWNRKAKRLSSVRVVSKASLRYALRIFNRVSNFAFDVCKLTCVGVKINHRSYLSLKTWQCVLHFETVIFYVSFIYDFFFLWRVRCIFRVVRQINKRGFTWTASKGLRGLTCKLRWTSSNNKHIRKLDTLIAAERSKILRRHGLTWPHTIHSIKLSSFQ